MNGGLCIFVTENNTDSFSLELNNWILSVSFKVFLTSLSYFTEFQSASLNPVTLVS